MKRRSGFSLVELMISLAILSIVMVALTYLFARQSRTYTVVDQVAEAQQTMRGIGGLVERETRTTGFMVPEAAAFCGVDLTGDSDILFVSDSDAINPDGETKPDLGMPISAADYSGTGSSEALGVGGLVVDGDPYYDIDADGSPESDFLYDSGGGGRRAGVIVVDRDKPDRGSSCGFITGLSASTITVDFTLGGAAGGGTPLDSTTGTTVDLVAVPAHYYRIDANDQLIRDGLVLAQDVEDLQFALFYDDNGNGEVDAPTDEYPGSENGNVYQSGSWDNRLLREIRLAFVVRTQSEDRDTLEDAGKAQNTFQTTFNRSDPGGSDGFRRRVHRTRVRPRNVGLR